MPLKLFNLAFLFLIFLLPASLLAQIQKVGLARYEIASPQDESYLEKAIHETLLASLKTSHSEWQIVELSENESTLKKKNLALFLKKEGLDFLIAGTITKIGSEALINTRLYSAQNPSSPTLVSHSIEDTAKALPQLKKHAQQIAQSVINLPEAHPRQKHAEVEPPSRKPKVEEAKQPPVVDKTIRKIDTRKQSLPPQMPAGTLSDYRWMSEKMPFEGQSFSFGDFNGDNKPELAVVSEHTVYFYEWTQSSFRLIAQYQGKANDHFIKVFGLDLTNDGVKEILISNVRNGQAASLGLSWKGSQFETIFENAPWLIKTLSWEGKTLLLGEGFQGRELNSHQLWTLKLEDKKLKKDQEFPTPKEIGLYGFTEFGAQRFVSLSSLGNLKIYEQKDHSYKKIATSSENYGGSFNSIDLEQRNVLNQVEQNLTYFNLDPVVDFLHSSPTVIAPNNQNFLKGLIGTKPILKNSWIAKLRLEETGLREVWVSRKIDGAITELQVIKLPWYPKPQIVALVWLRDQGFLNAMGQFKSVIAVYDLE